MSALTGAQTGTREAAQAGDVRMSADAVSVELGGASILRDVSLDVVAGEVLVLVGPNGAGKSTLLATLAGDIKPVSGAVLVDGKPLSAYRPKDLARRRAVQPQEAHLAFGFRVADVVSMGRAPWPADAVEDREIVAEAMRRTGVLHLATRLFPSLSGGERARVTFARVLAQQTGIILLDEPTAALDLGHQERTLAHARELAAAGSAVVVVLHDLRLAAAYADRIALMSRGGIRAVGVPREVLTASVLEDVYEYPVDVFDHGGELMVVPHRADATRRSA